MNLTHLSPDAVWLAIAVAFALGFVVKQLNFPPLIGFLAAGFVLHYMGFSAKGRAELHQALQVVAEYGVYLLLFSIGLKLQLRSLARAEIWGGASLHATITTLIFWGVLLLMSLIPMSLLDSLKGGPCLVLAFALSFSSTVLAVKILEEKGETATMHGRVAIGILIVQDLFAIVFLTASTGKPPSVWALTLLALPLTRPILNYLMERCGHGELLVLMGMLLISGTLFFGYLGIKPDLGALLLGVLVGGHRKAKELSNTLMSFKDFFLVAFFLDIGFQQEPTFAILGVSFLLALFVVGKTVLFFFILIAFRLRARTALLASLALTSYSEFGLIVGKVGVDNGWIGREWLMIIAIALSITYLIAAPLNAQAHSIYARFSAQLHRFETEKRVREDERIDLGGAKILIIGMGRIGTAAFETLSEHYPELILGVDCDPQSVERHQRESRIVIQGDGTDPDFWIRTRIEGTVSVVMLALRTQAANVQAIERLRGCGYKGTIAAIARFQDEVNELQEAGAHLVCTFYSKAGVGFADQVHTWLNEHLLSSTD